MSEMDQLQELTCRTLENTEAAKSGVARLDATDRQISRVKEDLRSLARQFSWLLSIGVILIVVIGLAGAIQFYNISQEQHRVKAQQDQIKHALMINNAKFCPIIAGLAPRADDAPPVGTKKQRERAQRIRDTFARLAVDPDFSCSPPPGTD